MKTNSIINQLKFFYKSNKTLSLLIIVNFVALILVRSNVFNLFYNVYLCYFAGKLFVTYLDNKKLISTYIYGAIAGALIYLLFFGTNNFNGNIFISISVTSAILALLVAIATFIPNFSLMLFIFGKVKLKHIAIVLVILDIITINPKYPSANISHLGGILWGYFSIYLLKHNFDTSKFLHWFTKPNTKVKKEKPKGRPASDDEYNKNKKVKQKEIDAILDKISKSGYDSLSKKEKETLFKMKKK